MDLPVIILGNDFQNPDINRYLERFDEHDTSVGVLLDYYTPNEVKGLKGVARKLEESYVEEYV